MRVFGFLLDTDSKFARLMTRIGIVVVSNLMYLFLTIAAFQNSTINLVKNTFFLIMKKPLIAVGMIVCNTAPVAVAYFDEMNYSAYAFFFVGFALMVWIYAWLLLKIFAEYLLVENKS